MGQKVSPIGLRIGIIKLGNQNGMLVVKILLNT